ncbi:MAG: HD domain-containing protein [Chloroflexi bacterium]|nr:HD domain-containing protein [Chloroflexota bacterium]
MRASPNCKEVITLTEGRSEDKLVTLDDVKQNHQVQVFLKQADEQLGAIGYTEHGHRHAGLVASIARNVLLRLDYPPRSAELAAISGYLHDIGNVISRFEHGHAGGMIAMDVLSRMGVSAEEIALIIGAIGNHEEETGDPVSEVSAALIIADKSDVHRTRVRNLNPTAFDIHDRVNYASERSFVRVDDETKRVALELTIDVQIAAIMEYFEIFLSRMLFIKKAVAFLNCEFELIINKSRIL